MIPVDYIEAVFLKVDLIELIGESITLKRAGKEFKALCPFHNERTPSFMVSPQKQLFHCHGCGSSGDAATWLEKYSGKSFPEAIRTLAERVGMPPPPDNSADREKLAALAPLKEAVQIAHDFYRKTLLQSPQVLEYLESRGVSRSNADRWGLGYAPARYRIDGVRGSVAAAAGIATQTDQGTFRWLMRDRLIFPVRNSSGTVVAFGGRRMGEDGPKYLNSSESPLYTKGNHLYGVGEVIASAPKVCLHEGYMDSLVCNIHAIPSLAVCSATLSDVQADLLLSRHAEIVLMFDPDEAGRRASVKSLEVLLPKAKPRHTIRVATLPEGVDPDEYVLAAGAAAMEDLRDRAPVASEWILSGLENKSVEEGAKHLDWIKALASKLSGSYGEAFIAELQRRGVRVVDNKIRYERPVRHTYHSLPIAMKMTAVILDRPDFARSPFFSAHLMPEPARTLARVIRQRRDATAATVMSMLTPEWQKGVQPAVEVGLPELSEIDLKALYLETALEEAKRACMESPTSERIALCETLTQRLESIDAGEEDDEALSLSSLPEESEEEIPMLD